ncbi:hypothetical protein RRG08_024778 [Elysia crispata]|uniref:Uncharacterized protein n=1 Tax=Elysia crispata TaxID=231223 RepID=A0AAE0Y6N0_9GAST|nr:hypothetical protein RRG08_024778 [Elysia crispata]
MASFETTRLQGYQATSVPVMPPSFSSQDEFQMAAAEVVIKTPRQTVSVCCSTANDRKSRFRTGLLRIELATLDPTSTDSHIRDRTAAIFLAFKCPVDHVINVCFGNRASGDSSSQPCFLGSEKY